VNGSTDGYKISAIYNGRSMRLLDCGMLEEITQLDEQRDRNDFSIIMWKNYYLGRKLIIEDKLTGFFGEVDRVRNAVRSRVRCPSSQIIMSKTLKIFGKESWKIILAAIVR
jgi:hypothetical protein